MSKFSIPAEQLDEVRSWFATRGGVFMWTSCDLSAPRPDVLTPKTTPDGKHPNAPHWAYVGQPVELKPEDIDVRTETAVIPPADWFPPCEHCKTTGRRSLDDLAHARKEKPSVTHAAIIDGTIRVTGYNGKDEFDCSWCQGTGHIERNLYVAIRKPNSWAAKLTDTGILRANKYAKRLGDDVKWTWEYVGYGRAELKFYRESIVPFTLGGTRSQASADAKCV